MNRKTVEVFHALMKKGWIERQSDNAEWCYSLESDVLDELEDFQEVLGFELHRIRDRLYMIPTQDNDLFLKNNADFKKDISSSEIRIRDICLMNFMAVYLLYLFFNGEGTDNMCRDMISEEDFISEFTKYCEPYEKSEKKAEELQGCSDNFMLICNDWLTKTEGEYDSKKINTKYGVVNKLLVKLKADDIFTMDENRIIRPSKKCIDLMPYFLKKDRITDINNWIREEEENAAVK